MNVVTKMDHNDIMNNFQKTDNILSDVQNIIEFYYRCMTKLHVNGMRKKHMNRPGVCARYREI